MSDPALKKLLDLPVEEKVDLIDKLWESVGRSAQFELTEAQRSELDRRIGDYDANASETHSLDEVLKGLA